MVRLLGAGWSRPAEVPAWIQKVGEDLPKRRPYASGKRPDPTTGQFNGERIQSGGTDRSIAHDLVPWAHGVPLDVDWQHVESKVAARMRPGGPAEEELVLNHVPCGNGEWDQDSPWTCEKILPTILPARSRLTVWATGDKGQTWWRKTYVGTGERIRP